NMTDYLVGTDIGTGGTKSVLIDTEGNVLGSHYIEYPLIFPKPGWAEHNPEWYWNAVADTIKASIKESRVSSKYIKAVSISALSPACILVDKNLNPLQNAHIWMDRRATNECQWLKENIGEDVIFELTGNIIDPYYAASKLMWEKNNRPDLYKETYKLQTAADYPVAKLTGKALTDYSNASLIGIAFDIVNRRWDEKMIEKIGLDVNKFPQAYPCDQVIGEVTSQAGRETGLAPGTPVVAGTVDYNAASLAMGVIDEGDNSLVMGTGGVWGVVHSEPNFTKNLVTIIPTAYSRQKYTTTATLACCGALMKYFRDTFGQAEQITEKQLGVSAYEIMNLEAEKIAAGSDGLIILPYLMGERAPIWNPLARGVLFGLSLTHKRGHIIRAMMESVGYAVLHNIELAKQSEISINSPLFLGEGGAQSSLWRQIISDILNKECVYIKEFRGAPLGNAINAGVGVGIFKDYHIIKDWLTITDEIKPNPKLHQLYNRMYRIYRELYPALKKYYKELAQIN
ncbi:MAG: carbohydrate kinase, partial [Clostridia bacterium]|nr:carbohydrate kinase [Clostridia bacterium]